MAQGKHLLNNRLVQTLGPGRHADGGNLYLIVDESCSRRWMMRYQLGGRRREMGLGGYPAVSLAGARVEAHRASELLAKGIDPISNRKSEAAAQQAAVAGMETFGSFADRWFAEKMEPQLQSEKHKYQWKQTLGDSYCASLRKKPISEVNTDDVVAVLKPIWLVVPETAKRLRGRIEAVLGAAKAQRLRSGENPAQWRGHLSHMLSKSPKLTRGHHKALSWEKVPALMARLRGREAIASDALQFIILTASRPGEALGARWSEIDLKRKIWTVPAKRMKKRKEHRVPLTTSALAVLERMKQYRSDDGDQLVFPGDTERPMSPATLVRLRVRMKEPHYTTHGFRSSFRDWAAEATHVPREVAEGCLAHELGDTERAYQRADFLERKRSLLQGWDNHCAAIEGANVHVLHPALSQPTPAAAPAISQQLASLAN
ncbi:MAG: site-specific integrase [Burkholderiales bacterium]|nr:MAG: site-specific integrase [Burkholderiales bacterium]